MNSFYLTLPSDSSMDIFSSNTQCCFHVKLPQKISLDKEQWEVAIVEMIIPSQYHNITKEEAYFDIVTTDKTFYEEIMDIKPKTVFVVTKMGQNPPTWQIRIRFSSGYYTNGAHLISVMNDVLQSQFQHIWQRKGQKLELKFLKSMNRPKILMDRIRHTHVRFSPTLFQKLGGAPEKTQFIEPNTFTDFPFNTDLDIGFNQLFVYSDLVEYTIVGHIQAPILRVVPFRSFHGGKDGNQHIHQEYLNLHYLPIAKSDFDTVGINIRGDLGDPIQFVGGKSMVKLHFRKRIQQ